MTDSRSSQPCYVTPAEPTLSSVRTSDGCEHFLSEWRSQTDTKATVIYLHGIEGHASWFAQTAAYLASFGITTIAVDRRGSGLSKERRGDASDFRRLVKDVEEVIADTVKKQENVPVFLMANCWGAKLAALVCRKSSSVARHLSGVVLSSPAVSVKVDMSIGKKIEILIRRICGDLTPVKLPLVPENFTDNEKYLALIRNDELRLTEATSRFLIEGFVLTLLSGKASPSIEMPLLIVQSGIDDIVNIEGVQKWFSKCASRDKTFKIFPGVFHSLDFHAEPAEYRDVLSQWLLARCSPSAKVAR